MFVEGLFDLFGQNGSNFAAKKFSSLKSSASSLSLFTIVPVSHMNFKHFAARRRTSLQCHVPFSDSLFKKASVVPFLLTHLF